MTDTAAPAELGVRFNAHVVGDRVEARFPYSPDLVAAVKTIPGRRWDPDVKCWYWQPAQVDALEVLRRLGAALTPDAEAWLSRYAPTTDRRDAHVMTEVDVPPDYPWLAKTRGRPHQVAASAWRRGYGKDQRKHRRGAYEMGLGTGKTLTAIEEIHKLKAALPNARVLILCPNAVMRLVWYAQIHQHSSIPLQVRVLDGPMAQRRIALEREWGTFDVWVHNHESLSEMGLALAGKRWDMIVLDEHSKFRSHLSARSKCLLGQGRFKNHPLTGPYQLALSGTPLIKKATDVYTTYKWLGAPTGTIAQFRQRHCIMGGYEDYDEVGIKPNSGLHEMLDAHRFVIPKDAVLKLPRSFTTHEVQLPDWQREIYERVRVECKVAIEAAGARGRDGEELPHEEGKLEANLTNHLTILLRLQEVNAGIESVGDAYHWHARNAKTRYLIDELLPDLFAEDPDGKVILWCWFRHEIRHLAETLAAAGYRPVTFYGAMKTSERDAAVERFRHGDANVFIGQAAAAGLGLNLPEARTMVYVSRSFDTEAYLQSLDRNHRLDTGHTDLRVVILEAADTVDQAVTGILTRNATLAGSVTSIDPARVLDLSRLPSTSALVSQAIGLRR
jgi:SWI/SNF-related matrix-associated actin-dependent regulator of chromatin subfamily A-like protein 1